VHVVGKDNLGVDMERCAGAPLPNSVAQASMRAAAGSTDGQAGSL